LVAIAPTSDKPNPTPEAIVFIPKQVTQIQDGAFENCSSIRKVVIPSKVNAVGRSAFEGCTSLEEVWFQSQKASCGLMTFYNCPKLKRIYVPKGTKSTYLENGLGHISHLVIEY
jgi:hypothetical protein